MTIPPPSQRPEDEIVDDLLRRTSGPVNIRLERRRYGKAVTVIDGFGPDADVVALAKELKHRLATGGTQKEGRIELQGDQRDRATRELEALGLPAVAPERTQTSSDESPTN